MDVTLINFQETDFEIYLEIRDITLHDKFVKMKLKSSKIFKTYIFFERDFLKYFENSKINNYYNNFQVLL